MIKADHFIGRSFVGFQTAADYKWGIELGGNVVIRNQDEAFSSPEDCLTPSGSDPTGLALLKVTETDTNTELAFGSFNLDQTVNFGPSMMLSLQYTISSPDIDEIEPRAVQPVQVPEDPSPDRVANGPT